MCVILCKKTPLLALMGVPFLVFVFYLLVFPLQIPLILDQGKILLNRLLTDSQCCSFSSTTSSPSLPTSPPFPPTSQVQAQIEAVGGKGVQPGWGKFRSAFTWALKNVLMLMMTSQ